jgi:hypothetical protein
VADSLLNALDFGLLFSQMLVHRASVERRFQFLELGIDAGFILQIDDPALVDIYDWWFSMNDDIAGFRKWAAFQVEAVNHALKGINEDRVRFHICWGSWHGPHKGDVGLKHVVDLLLKVKAQAYMSMSGKSGEQRSCLKAKWAARTLLLELIVASAGASVRKLLGRNLKRYRKAPNWQPKSFGPSAGLAHPVSS